jgi:hypothetical protein
MGQQEPGDDGRRYTRFAIIRQSLKDAKATVLRDARGWFGVMADWRVSESILYIEYGDIHSEWFFIPLENPEDIKRLLSTQLTGAYINEASEVDVDVLSHIAGRVGRYPNNEFGVPNWKGIFADTNMPVFNSPWCEFILDPPPLWQVFRQPSGLSEEAENLDHLDQTAVTLDLPEGDPIRIAQGRQYYARLAATGDVDYIKRFVMGEFGRDVSGSAVYQESFKYEFHVRDNIDPVPSRLLVVGQDFGRNPWSIICQLDHKGRLNVLEEVAGNDIGLEQHAKQSLIPALLQERYAGLPMVLVGDPSGAARDSLFELNCFDLLTSFGLPAERAPTNDLDPRIRSVESFLNRQVDGGGAILFDRARCPTLVQAMGGGYRYSKDKNEQSRSLPDKNQYSHVSDALQYVCLIAGNMSAYSWLLGRVITRKTKTRPKSKVSALAWT